MKKNWKVKKLGDILEIERGGSPRPIDSFLTDSPDGINWIKIGDTKGITKYIYETKEKIKPEGARRSRMVKENDFILSNSMSFGKPYIMKTTGCIHDGWLVLRAKESNIDNDFLYHVLSSDLIYKQFDNLAAGSTVRNLNIDLVKKVEIPLPPLPEQQRIVAILDEAFTAIAKARENTEKNLQNVREFFENYQQSIFIKRDDGWIEKPLGELATFRNGVNFTKTSRGDSAKIVGVKDFQKNFWAPLDNLDVVTMEGTLPESDKLKENDILFVRSNGNMELIGRCLLVGKVTDKITYSGFTIRARQHGDSVMPKYLCHFLKSNSTRRKMIDSGIGTNIKSLNQPTLAALVIPFPSISEQARLVDQLEAIEAETKHLESIYKQKLVALEELKKSILQKAFSGELTASSEPTANDELPVPRFIQQEMVWA